MNKYSQKTANSNCTKRKQLSKYIFQAASIPAFSKTTTLQNSMNSIRIPALGNSFWHRLSNSKALDNYKQIQRFKLQQLYQVEATCSWKKFESRSKTDQIWRPLVDSQILSSFVRVLGHLTTPQEVLNILCASLSAVTGRSFLKLKYFTRDASRPFTLNFNNNGC